MSWLQPLCSSSLEYGLQLQVMKKTKALLDLLGGSGIVIHQMKALGVLVDLKKKTKHTKATLIVQIGI